jgi:hypothetical protein
VDFREVDSRYFELKQRYESGALTDEKFEELLKELMVQDEEGRWWAKSRQTGTWHYHDGERWVKDTPPDYEPPSQTMPTEGAPNSESRAEQVDQPPSEDRSQDDRSAPTQAYRPAEEHPPVRTPLREDPSRTRPEPTEQQQPQRPLPDEQRRRGYGKWIVIGCFVVATIALVAIIRAVSSPAVAPPPDPGDIFQDDFGSVSDVSRNWNTRETDDFTVEHANGSLHLSHEKPDSGVSTLVGYDVGDTLDVEDVVVEVDGTQVSEKTDWGDWGVICRAQDYDNFYLAQLKTDGSVDIFKQEDGEWNELTSADADDAFRGNRATNHLRFDCVGNQLTAYVNDHEVVKTEDSEYRSGNVGLSADVSNEGSSGFEVSFDNFLASRP